MNIPKLISLVEKSYKAEVYAPYCIIGDRGIGKTETITQLAEKLKLPLVVLRLAQDEESDIMGRMETVNGKTVYATPPWLKDESFLLFLDEFNRQLRPEVLNAVTQLIEPGKDGIYRFHTHELPAKSYVICAGNPVNEHYDTAEVDSAWLDRVTVVDVDFSYEAFHSYIVKKKWDEKIIKFLETHSELAFQPPSTDEGKKTPSPRAWERVANLLERGVFNTPLETEEIEAIGGIVGTESAVIFAEFIKKSGKVIKLNADDFWDDFQKLENDLAKADAGNRNDKIVSCIELIVMKLKENEEMRNGSDKATLKAVRSFILSKKITDTFRLLLITKITEADELAPLYDSFCQIKEIKDEVDNILK